MLRTALLCVVVVLCLGATLTSLDAQSFVNWENGHANPIDITDDGNTLVAVNTADNRLEVFDISSGNAVHLQSIPVGLDPVSVRTTGSVAYVVNHISDSVSVVDLASGNTVATLATDDEPYDVEFAGSPARVFVSCSQANTLLVFDPADLSLPPTRLEIQAQDPRALTVSADGSEVYLAVWESGNATTILGGGIQNLGPGAFPPNVVSHPAGPYGGQNPPPNDGNGFSPPINEPNPPAVGLIVKRVAGLWIDDNGGDWTDLVTGNLASLSGRQTGWDLVDHDVAIVDANTLAVSYATGLMNICMNVALNPGDGTVTVVGTDGTNEVRFEPNLSGKFLRVLLAKFDPSDPMNPTIVDLNAHLDYSQSTIPQTERDKSIGDPRDIVWNAAGDRGYVAGMGSNNLLIIDANGARSGLAPTVEVGEGPTGLALDESRQRLYVLNKFEGSISVVDTASELELGRVSFYDPTPTDIKVGRKHLYDTHKSSGLGHTACGSCHVDGRMDRLAWDLGDPSGVSKPFNQNCLAGADPTCQDWHPMKGPMSTQTLQDIIGHEPHHWRGDNEGIEAFNPAFMGLQGDDQMLSAGEMQEFEDFLDTITYPPNPFRNFDNTLPTSLDMPGHYTTGRFNPAGQPLPPGNAVTGLARYRTGGLDGIFQCVSCHTLPTGEGTDHLLQGPVLVPHPLGPNGEHHASTTGLDGSTNVTMKVPQLRNLYEKTGFNTTQLENTAGFGTLHDGSVDSIERFLAEPVFSFVSDQDIANMLAFMLAFSGSDLPEGSPNNPLEPPGLPSQDTHAAVGAQVTVTVDNKNDGDIVARLGEFMALADLDEVGMVVKGMRNGLARGGQYLGGGLMQLDRQVEQTTVDVLRQNTSAGEEITFTLVPEGSENRIGVDRDQDGFYDRDELDGCSDPADPQSVPPGPGCSDVFRRGDCNNSGDEDIADVVFILEHLFQSGAGPQCDDARDVNDDGAIDAADPIYQLSFLFDNGAPPPPPLGACGVDPTADVLGCDAANCP